MNTHIKEADILTRLIAAIIPAAVCECAMRVVPNKMSDEQLGALWENTAADMLSECDFDVEDATNCTGQKRAGLSLIQGLKVELYDIMRDSQRQLIDDVRTAIKEELRMEMFLELQQMQDNRPREASRSSKSSNLGPESESTLFPSFPSQRSTGPSTDIDLAIGDWRDATIMPRADRSTRPSGTSWGDSAPHVYTGIAALEDNPLYTRVTNNLAHHAENQPMYSIDDIITAKHFDVDEATMLAINNAKKQLEEYEIRQMKDQSDICEDDDVARWDKLFEEKLKANQ